MRPIKNPENKPREGVTGEGVGEGFVLAGIPTQSAQRTYENTEIPDIFIDDREDKRLVEKMCNGFPEGTIVCIKRMLVGDVVCGDVVIERKTVGDFFNSVHSKRIWDQAFNMKQEFPVRAVVIVGDIFEGIAMRKFRNDHALRTFVAVCFKLFVKFGVSVITLPNEWSYCYFISRLVIPGKEKSDRPTPHKHTRVNLEHVAEDMLCMIPKIGRNKAKIIRESIGSLQEISNCEIEKLNKIEGIGKKLAGEIYNVFRV